MNAAERPQKTIAVLQAENRKLRERVDELERVALGGGGSQLDKSESRMFRLVKEKDKVLTDFAARLEKKSLELEKALHAAEQADENLANNQAVLRLYQLIFENEPIGFLGIDRDGMVVQFNSSAIRILGVDLHARYLQPADTIRMDGASEAVDFGDLFRQALDGDALERTVEMKDGPPVEISAYRLEDNQGVRGVIFRFADR